MAKAGACWYCRNVQNSRVEKSGWHHDCKLGIDNTGFDNKEKIAEQCQSFDPREGFQMGGYYTHMWFEGGVDDPNGCLEWVIQGDLEFPIHDNETEKDPIKIHICDFRQIEEWVSFWGKELRKRGWVSDEQDDRRAGTCPHGVSVENICSVCDEAII